MRVDLIRIGNSRGIRLPKPVIEQCGFGNTVELHIEDNRVVLTPVRSLRERWTEAFQEMARRGDDDLVLKEATANKFDATEWTW